MWVNNCANSIAAPLHRTNPPCLIKYANNLINLWQRMSNRDGERGC